MNPTTNRAGFAINRMVELRMARVASAAPAGAVSRSPLAFTLVEMLVVIAIIAILTGLTLPALQGLLGTSGLRGGVSSVLLALEQARNAAVESGADVYVGFPVEGSVGADYDKSSLVVFRSAGPNDEEDAPDYIPLSRWIRLPEGILVDTDKANLLQPPDLNADDLPRLAGKPVEVRAIRFDRFGRIANALGDDDTLELRVGEGFVGGDGIKWKGPFGKNYELLTAQRLTGRWLVSRP